MNGALERLGTWAARRHWWVIGAWIVILVGLSLGRNLAGGDFVNDYSVPGSESQQGLDRAASRSRSSRRRRSNLRQRRWSRPPS